MADRPYILSVYKFTAIFQKMMKCFPEFSAFIWCWNSKDILQKKKSLAK